MLSWTENDQGSLGELSQIGVDGFDRVSHLQTLMIYKLGFNQSYDTFTSITQIKIVLCSEFPWTEFMNDKCFHMISPIALGQDDSIAHPPVALCANAPRTRAGVGPTPSLPHPLPLVCSRQWI